MRKAAWAEDWTMDTSVRRRALFDVRALRGLGVPATTGRRGHWLADSRRSLVASGQPGVLPVRLEAYM